MRCEVAGQGVAPGILQAMPTLYTTALSANGRKPLAVLSELGVSEGFEVREVNVYRGAGRAPWFLAINPAGKIPTLVDGDLVLSESNAIMLYLDEVYGDARLSSRAPRERAEVLRWLFWESSQWQPATARVLSPFVAHRLLPDAIPAPKEPPQWEEQGLVPLLGLLERHLEPRSWLALERLTVADFAVAGMMTYFAPAGFPAEVYPAIGRWYSRLAGRAAWEETAHRLWSGG